MIIAITGCIGSGKSYILHKINEIYGYKIYSSDEFVKESYLNAQIKKELDNHFHCLINDEVDKSIIKKQPFYQYLKPYFCKLTLFFF